MRFKGLDLNLMVALDVLLEERNVSRAARRLHVTQPAMSAALGRLRAFFHDDILVTHGKRMIPTSTGESLGPLVKSILAEVDVLVSTATMFDPAHSQRTFRIAASDYITTVLLTPLVAALERSAPGVSLEIRLTSEQSVPQLDRGDIDLLFTPTQYISGDHPADLIFEEDHVVVGWKKNPVFRRKLDEAAFFEAGHVAVLIGGDRGPSFAERQLREMGRKCRVELVAPSFLEVPWLLVRSQRLAVMHRRLAEVMVPALPLAMAPMPFAFPPMREMMQYHKARQVDAGLTWLRSEARKLAAQL